MNPNKTLFLALQLICCTLFGQQGLISGSVVNGSKKAVKDATVSCIPLNDTIATQTMATDKLGQFAFSGLNDGDHRLVITHAAYGRRVVDSIHIRKDRNSFHLDELVLPDKLVREEEVTVYAEKPLIEMTRDGKIVFNTSESAGAQTASATDLLKSTPLVSVDPNGNVLLKGKEVKVLIDEKPVELNARELQELLESMQGSNIEKIEVMTNPPPQYANERGGVINIVTKKGKTGLTLRASMYYGTRGEWGGNLTAGYKKNKTSVQLSSGFGRGIFTGESSSLRQNFYTDSANRFNTGSEYENLGDRPSYRLQFNYDPNKRNQFSTTVQWNRNRTDNQSLATYTNINRFNLPWRISERNIQTNGLNNGLNVSASYTAKDKPQTGVFRAIAGVFSGDNYSDRDFFQVFFDGQKIPTGVDSTQEQV
ncbi:MAG: TonB-dependent receptor, partial [Dinghuibacter sp.]|nr:TonB-dependent receptor [Dinghuibacter sp.]